MYHSVFTESVKSVFVGERNQIIQCKDIYVFISHSSFYCFLVLGLFLCIIEQGLKLSSAKETVPSPYKFH